MSKFRIAIIVLLTLCAVPAAADSGLKITPYGFLDASAWYHDTAFAVSELPLYPIGGAAMNKDMFGFSPRSTRLGLKLAATQISNFTFSGVVEIDFSGPYADSSNAAENQPLPRLRHAYMDILFKDGDYSWGAKLGSTWTVISPLFPDMNNPSLAAGAGNLWNRFPQFQFYGDMKMGDLGLGAKVALVRALSGSSLYKNTYLTTAIDAGDAAALPMLQAELHLNGKMGDVGFLLSASTALGKEDYGSAFNPTPGAAVSGNKLDVSVLTASLQVKVGPLTLEAEAYTGKNLDCFYQQLGQAVYATNVTGGKRYEESIKSRGGWAQLSVAPMKGIKLSVGGGQDDPENRASGTGFTQNYDSNTSYWGTLTVFLFQGFCISLTDQYFVKRVGGNDYRGNTFILATRYFF